MWIRWIRIRNTAFGYQGLAYELGSESEAGDKDGAAGGPEHGRHAEDPVAGEQGIPRPEVDPEDGGEGQQGAQQVGHLPTHLPADRTEAVGHGRRWCSNFK